MELYIKESRQDYVEVIDLAYPQFLFIFEDIGISENSGNLEIVVNKASVMKNDKVESSEISNEDEFLSTHTELIIDELFRETLEKVLG